MRHNKKRNLGVLYNILSKEYTRRAADPNGKPEVVLSLLKEHFSKDSLLLKELSLYKDMLSTVGDSAVTSKMAEKIIFEAKMLRSRIDSDKLENAKTALIDSINKKLGADIWNTHVENYKSYAQIYQILLPESKSSIPERVIAEEAFITSISEDSRVQIDESLSVRTVVDFALKNFEKDYKAALLPEQYAVIMESVHIPEDDGIKFHSVVKQEFHKINKTLRAALSTPDPELRQVIRESLTNLPNNERKVLEEKDLHIILNLQALASELRAAFKESK